MGQGALGLSVRISIMTSLLHRSDLLGKVIEKLTGVHIPLKKSNFGKDYGLRPRMSIDCPPQTLHFSYTGRLKFQVNVYCSSGEMGKPDSIYTADFSAVQDATELVCFKATGCFVLIPPVASASSIRLYTKLIQSIMHHLYRHLSSRQN